MRLRFFKQVLRSIYAIRDMYVCADPKLETTQNWKCVRTGAFFTSQRHKNNPKPGKNLFLKIDQTGAAQGIFLSQRNKKQPKTGAKFSSKNRLDRGKF